LLSVTSRLVFFLFFFSSRRRHTRSDRDWSSDVCSSDLNNEVGVYRGPHYYSHTPMIRIQLDLGRLESFPTNLIPGFTEALQAWRSEERRVGKGGDLGGRRTSKKKKETEMLTGCGWR